MMMVHIVALLLHFHLYLLSVLNVNNLRMLYQLWLGQVPEDVLLQLWRVLIVVHNAHGHSEMSVEQLIELKILKYGY